MGVSMMHGNKLRLVIIGAVLLGMVASCGGESNSALEASLRAQLSETQTQLEQAQELIVNLQTEIAATEATEQEMETEAEPVIEEETLEETDESPSEEDIDSLLTISYLWLQESDDTVLLQEFLGVEADGWYGSGTVSYTHLTLPTICSV